MNPETIGYRSILVPLDFAGCAAEVVVHARRIAKAFGARVTLAYIVALPLGVHRDDPRGDTTVGAILEAEARAELGAFAMMLGNDPEVTVHVEIRFGEVVPSVLTLIDEVRADLVIMGTHGRTGFRRLMLGSVAEQIVRAGRAPVLTVHAPRGMADHHSPAWEQAAAERDG